MSEAARYIAPAPEELAAGAAVHDRLRRERAAEVAAEAAEAAARGQ